MFKKFVPLNTNASPSKNPYEVRTFMGDRTKIPEWKVESPLCPPRKCPLPVNSTLGKVITIEDEIRRLHHKTQESRFKRAGKRPCQLHDDYITCVIPQRTPKELKQHAILREKYLRVKSSLDTRTHDGSMPVSAAPSVVKLNSPIQIDGSEEEEQGEEEEEEGKSVKPQLASPPCSDLAIYIPPQKLLELHRPKSGMFHNETDPPEFEGEGFDYSKYNPRSLQEQFDAQKLQSIDIIEGAHPKDLWTWNIGKQQPGSELERVLADATIAKLDFNLELTLYSIPRDLPDVLRAQVVFGTTKIDPEVIKKRRYFNRPMEIAVIFVAYIESFRFSPDFWTNQIIDNILMLGEKLHKKSTAFNYKSSDTDFDIIPTIPEKQAAVGLRIHFTGPLTSEPNIYKALHLFFTKYSACVLVSDNLFLLIWKHCQDIFYIFDPNGRDETCLRNFTDGFAGLMLMNHIEYVVQLVVNFCSLELTSDFHLYEMYLINYGKITVPLPEKQLGRPKRKLWAVVNNTYALIPSANSGLHQPMTPNERNPSMVIATLALLYADIEHPTVWRMEVLDELIKYGQAYYKSFMKRIEKKAKPKPKPHFNIVDLPEVFVMGVFRASLKKRPFLYTGHVADCQDFIKSHLVMTLKDFFSGKWEAGLLQIDNSVVAIWRDAEYFYMFDPFRRGVAGQVLDPEDYLTKGVACLQIHTSFESFCRILHQKAVKMRRGGKFFLHGIIVGCIKPVLSLADRHNKYKRLQLTYPSYEDEKEEKPEKKKKPKKLTRTYSIKSIPEEERIPEFTNADVVNSLIDEIIFDVLKGLQEPYTRISPYKQAEKVLLRSDKAYLESLKYDLKHGDDYDNFYVSFPTKPDRLPQITLADELALPSNFSMLPDNAWVLFGTSPLPVVNDDVGKLSGLLSSMVTAALTSKYKISTWNSDLIEFALESANSFNEDYQSYEQTLSAILAKKLPNITIGKDQFEIKVIKYLKSAATRPLRQVLLDCLISYKLLLVICQHFSCLVIKRYNFLYMFCGFPSDSVGYRKYGAGPGCLLRFLELDSLIRRIEFGCNPQGCEITNYVLVGLKVVHITDEKYRAFPKTQQELMYQSDLEIQKQIQQRKFEKMRFIDEELRKETQRIQGFLKEKEEIAAARKKKTRRSVLKSRRTQTEGESEWEEYEGEEEEEEEGEEEEEIQLKHKPGKKLRREILELYKPKPILYGYRLRKKDYLYKIQGSTAMEGRDISSLAEIKPCFFVSTLAILYAILRPLSEWNSQRVDRVLESGRVIGNKVSNMTTAYERVIKNVTVDDYLFDVWIKTFDVVGARTMPTARKIERAVQTRNYLLFQISNTTYAIYHDEYYHLFDPYGSMEKSGEGEEEQERSKKKKKKGKGEDEEGEEGQAEKKKIPKDIKRFGERNTASWILFADAKDMLNYIDERAANSDWQEYNEFKFHVVDILSHKRAAPTARILQLLTDVSLPMECRMAADGEDEANICTHNEALSWLELENCLPVWSRLRRRNIAGRYRNLPISKHKKYDVEIEGRLWSIWGNVHPQAPVFDIKSRGKQFLACNVLACCAARVYRLIDWSPQLLDNIVISGDRYHRESLEFIKQQDYEFSLEDLNIECYLENIKFIVHLEHVCYGKMYCAPSQTKMNLAEGLMYFFGHYQFGVLQCNKRSLAIGRTFGHDGGYFMYDCQSRDHPLYPKGQGASYLLRTKFLQVLHYCIVVTLKIPFYNQPFTLHKVDILPEGARVEEEEEGEEEN